MARKRLPLAGDVIDQSPRLSRLSEDILGPERLKFSLSWEM